MDRAPRFSRATIDWLQCTGCEARELAASNASDSAAERVAKLLLAMDGHGVSGELIEINQGEIARLVCVRRTTVCAMMKGFKDSGAIGYARARVRVLDRQRLEALIKL
ncbi:helix-turn-helix domain-containing protein [Brevundimonas sp. DC300-4]|uniref:helix-turn-helix domain-containing protein n=1 Tax=Brevundimonas sp. DC300-4 TaxID=2804594 RepID=UPI003CFA6FD5